MMSTVGRYNGLTGLLVVVGALAVTGCGNKPDEASCRDISKLERAIQPVSVEKGEAKDEILDDLQEVGADNNCPGYDDDDN